MIRGTHTKTGRNAAKLFSFCIGLALATFATADDLIPWRQDVKETGHISIGPIGARIKPQQIEERHPRSESGTAVVSYVFENSLADGKLKIGDVITGVNGKPIERDITKKLAEAIDWSEGNTGILTLDIERGGQASTAQFKLEKIGSYSETWPYDCPKSERILQDACDWLVEHQQSSGRFEEGGADFVLTSVAGLAMLGCDPDRYKKPLQKTVKFLTDQLKSKSNKGVYQGGNLQLWSLNYAAIFLSEYHMETGDRKVVKWLDFLDDNIFSHQFHQMDAEAEAHLRALRKRRGDQGDPVPPYWFSHGKVSPKSSGYVHLGVNVANACLAWTLLAEAGADVDVENLAATKDFIEQNCPSGAMGYAAKNGPRSTPSDAFGRTGVLGLALNLNNDRDVYTKTVAESLKRQYPKNLYFSHATCVMGKAWGILAIASLEPEQFRILMDSHRNDFDMLRLHDGSFVSNPAIKNRHGDIDLKGGASSGHKWTTAFNALVYTLSTKRLHISGGGNPAKVAAKPKAPANPNRTFTNAEETSTFVGSLVTFDPQGGIASIRRRDGSIVDVPLKNLSKKDQAYLKEYDETQQK